IRDSDLPLLSESEALAQQKFVTVASMRNWASYGDSVVLPPDCSEWRRHLLTDPQTSGGLLIACDSTRAADLLKRIVDSGYPRAQVIGRAESGKPEVRIVA